jgi:hypothetical protein
MNVNCVALLAEWCSGLANLLITLQGSMFFTQLGKAYPNDAY